MDQEFINIYIEKLVSRLNEYVKAEMILQTQLEMYKRINQKLLTENEELKTKSLESPEITPEPAPAPAPEPPPA